MIYAVESWFDIRDEVQPLFQRHWEEIAADRDTIPLVVDFDSYDALANADSLHIITARESGVLVGYFFSVVRTHLHYRETLFGFADIFYLLPEHRKGMAGVRLITETEKSLKTLGVKKMFAATKPWMDVGLIFKRQGFELHEIVYSKMIG